MHLCGLLGHHGSCGLPHLILAFPHPHTTSLVACRPVAAMYTKCMMPRSWALDLLCHGYQAQVAEPQAASLCISVLEDKEGLRCCGEDVPR